MMNLLGVIYLCVIKYMSYYLIFNRAAVNTVVASMSGGILGVICRFVSEILICKYKLLK